MAVVSEYIIRGPCLKGKVFFAQNEAAFSGKECISMTMNSLSVQYACARVDFGDVFEKGI